MAASCCLSAFLGRGLGRRREHEARIVDLVDLDLHPRESGAVSVVRTDPRGRMPGNRIMNFLDQSGIARRRLERMPEAVQILHDLGRTDSRADKVGEPLPDRVRIGNAWEQLADAGGLCGLDVVGETQGHQFLVQWHKAFTDAGLQLTQGVGTEMQIPDAILILPDLIQHQSCQFASPGAGEECQQWNPQRRRRPPMLESRQVAARVSGWISESRFACSIISLAGSSFRGPVVSNSASGHDQIAGP